MHLSSVPVCRVKSIIIVIACTLANGQFLVWLQQGYHSCSITVYTQLCPLKDTNILLSTKDGMEAGMTHHMFDLYMLETDL